MDNTEDRLFKVGELICLADGEWEDYHEYNHAIVLKDFDGKEEARKYLDEKTIGEYPIGSCDFFDWLEEKGLIKETTLKKIYVGDGWEENFDWFGAITEDEYWKNKAYQNRKKEEEMEDDFDEVPENENQICYPDEDCLEILKEKED